MDQCILSDRLYVPSEYVRPEHLNEFVYAVELQDGYEYGPFETVTGSVRTFSKVMIHGNLYYAFSRGNIEKLGRLFGDIPWINKTSAPKMSYPLVFKGSLHTWDSKKIGQQEAVDVWLKKRNGLIKAPPRFGKCCVGDTLIQVLNKGLMPIEKLFEKDHGNDEFLPKEIELTTKDGVQFTSHLYKQTVDQTIKITTEHGFKIEATRNHPLFIKSDDGQFSWKSMEDIHVGDIVALYAKSKTFSKKESNYVELYSRYIISNRKYSVRVLQRLMLLGQQTQQKVLDQILSKGEIELENEKILELLQVMLLNFGYMSRIIT